MAASPAGPPSSRDAAAGAGWDDCGGPGPWLSDVPVGVKPTSWMRPSTLWAARNDVLAKHLYDPVDRARREWVRIARQRAVAAGRDPDFVLRRAEGDAVSLLLLGDPGEGDSSQYAVVPPLLSQIEGIDCTIICSDVVYPSGETLDYKERFFRPYRQLGCPILAVPGNHDWYDGLQGFMSHICGIDLPAAPLQVDPGLRGKLTKLLWRRSSRPTDETIAEMRRDRGLPEQVCDPPQPGPYWALDIGPMRIVGIDTGIVGTVDAEQLEWLRRVSLGSDRPKVLVTGKPLFVNGKPLRAEAREAVDAIVRDRYARYVMAIGGDTHNYQRYPVTVDGRTIQYVVSGGGGAYTHATHQIPKVEGDGVTEKEFRCYPLRSDSLARFSQLYDERLAGNRGLLKLTPAEAASYLSELLDMEPVREQPQELGRRARIAARLLQPAPAKRGFHRLASEYFDWDTPPFFKQFLRLDAADGKLRVRCFGVSGCRSATREPPVEDTFTIEL
jgi:hypothetical protein